MKGKRYTTEDKIRILREADGGKSLVRVSFDIPECTFNVCGLGVGPRFRALLEAH